MERKEVGRDKEEVNIMASYTHPAIVATIYDQQKDFIE